MCAGEGNRPAAPASFELSTSLASLPETEQRFGADELRRGVPLSSLFAGLGRMIRTRTDALTVAEQKKLFRASRKVANFDAFISHVCSSPGRQKYLALVLDQLGRPAFVAALVVSLGLWAFEVCCRPLPRGALNPSFSLWELLGGLAAAWVVCVCGHVLCRRTCCFFDCASICSYDAELRDAGIKNIPAFLRASQEVVVLWDERYFTRLWCVYEIAVAQSFGAIPIRILPMGMYTLLAVIHMIMCVSSMFYIHVQNSVDDLSRWPWNMAYCLMVTPQSVLHAYVGRKLSDMQTRLQKQFDRFDVRTAAISVESDRRLIFTGIEELYCSLENFNNNVRTTLKLAAMRSLTGQKAMLPYRGMLWLYLNSLPYWLSCATSSRTRGKPGHLQVTQCIYIVACVFCWYPLKCAAAMEFGRRFATGARSIGPGAVAAYAAVGVVVAALGTAWTSLAYELPQSIGRGEWRGLGVEDWHGVPVAVLINGLACAAAMWVYWPRPAAEGAGADPGQDAERGG